MEFFKIFFSFFSFFKKLNIKFHLLRKIKYYLIYNNSQVFNKFFWKIKMEVTSENQENKNTFVYLDIAIGGEHGKN